MKRSQPRRAPAEENRLCPICARSGASGRLVRESRGHTGRAERRGEARTARFSQAWKLYPEPSAGNPFRPARPNHPPPIPPFLPSAPPQKRIQGSKPLSNNASLIQTTQRIHIHCAGSFRDVWLSGCRGCRWASLACLAHDACTDVRTVRITEYLALLPHPPLLACSSEMDVPGGPAWPGVEWLYDVTLLRTFP